MPAVGGGGRGNAGKSTRGAKRAARRRAAPTTRKVVTGRKAWTPPSSRSDAAQRTGATTERQAEARNRGRSDAGAPAGAGGYRMTVAERRARDENIRVTRGRVKGRRSAAAARRALRVGVGVGTQTGGRARRIGAAQAAERSAPLGLVPGRAVQGTALALKEDPIGTSKATARGFKDSIVGAPGAALRTAIDTVEGTADGDPLRGVKRSGKEYLDDVVRRYGPLLKEGGVEEFKERAKKEGVSAEIMDAAILVAGAGGAASRGLAAGARRRPESRAGRVVTEPRRRERTSGGEAREQPMGAGFFKVARQKARDERAFRGQQRVVDRADRRARERPSADGTTRKRAPVDAVVREATEAGEVVPSRISGLEVSRRGVRVARAPSQRKIAKRERVDFAGRKGRALRAQRQEQRLEGVAGGGHGAGRAYAGLSKPERVAYKAAITGARTPAAGRAWAEARIRRIELAIERGDVAPEDARELPALQALAADPEKHFTPELAEVAAGEVERGKRVAREDPRLGATVAEREQTAELRRRAPQMRVLGVSRKGRTTAAAERSAREQRNRGRKDRARAERSLRVAERRVGAAEETARRLAAQGKRRDAEQVVRAERAVEIHTRAAANHRRRAEKARGEKMREGHTRKAEAAEERAEAAGKRTAELVGRSAASEPRLRKRVVAAHGRREEVKAEVKRAEREIKAAAAEGRKAAALRRQYGRDALDPRTAEAIPAFLERGRERAAEAGLSEPGFFQSAPREARRFGVFTTGGFRSVPKDRRYKGTLFEQGREDGSFTTYAQGLARNMKAKHNWRLVTDTIAEHSFAWSRNRSVEEIRKELERRGIDPESVAFWSPGVFREAGDALETGDADALAGGDAKLLAQADVVGETLDVGQGQLARAVELAQDTGRFGTSRDWVAVPKGLMDELEADTRPSHWLWRGLDVVKGKQARILLGTSPAWLQFQVASNLLLTTMAGVGPLEIVRAQRWWSRLSDAEKAAIEPYVGVGHFHDSLDQARIGAAANGEVLNAWRAMKAHEFWHKPRKPLRGGAVSQLNPLDALFRLDNAQNNAFRKAVLYNRLKRDAYARMGENVALQQRLLDRAIGHLRYTRPEQTMSALARDHRVLERHAQSVADFLGDYQTYTARERRILGRNVMFYGFLRFSLRFTFYTMPVKHPVMASIVGQLGQLQTEEVRRLLGGNELPWAMGRFFFSKGGKLESINVARGNPFLNTVTELDLSRDLSDQLRNAIRFLPPVYVSLLDQAFNKSSFTNKDFRVEGETSGRGSLGDYGLGNRARIFLNDLARLNAIYREVDKGAQGGVPHGDDSLAGLDALAGGLWDGGSRPTEFKRFDIRAGIAESAEKFEQRGGMGGSLKRGFLPLVPQPDDSVGIAEKVRESRGTAPKPAASAEEKRLAEAYKGNAAAAPDEAELRRLLEAYGSK